MSKRREGEDNWYALGFDARKKLMEGHARVGRKYHGRVRQLITGSTGLDEWEWFVTLQAKDSFDIKAIVYEMRFDPVSARFADFGDFFIGLQLPLAEIFRRSCLR
jgi:chlorite dismutase